MALAGVEVEMWDRQLQCIVLSASPLDRDQGHLELWAPTSAETSMLTE